MQTKIVVTGANRGIGLSFCRHYSKQGAQIVAACRRSSSELNDLEVEVVEGFDVSNAESIKMLQETLKDQSIDLLINNAGILQNEVLGNIDYDSIVQQFHVNALGALRTSEALLGNFKSGSKIAMITSRMGSIADNTSGGRYGYRMSKAALNIAAVSLAHDLAPKGIAVGIFHPGLVGTDMIGGYGDITPDQAAEKLSQGIQNLTSENSGSFWHSNGESLPW